MHGWNHASIHQYHPRNIQGPSISYSFSGGARSHGLQTFLRAMPELSFIVLLDVLSQIPVHI